MALFISKRTRNVWSCLSHIDVTKCAPASAMHARWYAKIYKDDGCRKALVDLPRKVDPKCPHICERKKKKKQGILYRIKMKMIEGGTNFGTPFRRIQCKKLMVKKQEEVEKAVEKAVEKEVEKEVPIALAPPEKPSITCIVPPTRPGVQVSILGGDTTIGQYVAFLLKQCPCVKKLRLYEAKDTKNSLCGRNVQNVVQDLQHIDTNCVVQAFTCGTYELERCLQNSDIVLMLESGYVNIDMPFERRFSYQAPIVKHYANAIATECPKAFIIVCATPIECMVPLVAETLKETNWYDPRKLMGSLAVPEMRASTLAARALCLEPRYTRVPCVGGTEGESLVPLFSRAVEYFEFEQNNAEMMTAALRAAPKSVSRCDGICLQGGDLSEAHALAGLVSKVAYALVCQDLPRVTGFVETDSSQVISPARYMANPLEISGSGIWKNLGIPFMNNYEISLMDLAMNDISKKQKMAEDWHSKFCTASVKMDARQSHFFTVKRYERINDCAYANM